MSTKNTSQFFFFKLTSHSVSTHPFPLDWQQTCDIHCAFLTTLNVNNLKVKLVYKSKSNSYIHYSQSKQLFPSCRNVYKSLKFKTCQIFDKKFYKICHLVSENITQLYLEVFLHVKHFVIMKKAIFSLFIIKVPQKFYLPKKKNETEVSPHQNSTS